MKFFTKDSGWTDGSPRRLQEEERTDQTQPCRCYLGTIYYRNGDERGGILGGGKDMWQRNKRLTLRLL